MPTILARSRWTSTAARGSAITWSRVRGIVCHYPAMGASVGELTMAQEAARLRGWRSYHVNSLGWKDIGYSYAIGQSGRIYSLRGDRVGGHTYGHNSTTMGVLFIVGDNEPLTAAAKRSFRALRTTLRKRGAGAGIWGHTEMSGNSTRCPGPYIMGSIRDGSLRSAGIPAIPGGGTSVPKPPTPAPAPEFADVDKTQRWLAALGYDPGPVDGKYGTKTATATKAAQKNLGITPADGRPGPATRTHLEAAVTTLDKISKQLDGITRALEPGIAGKRTDGEFASFIRSQRDIIRADVGGVARTLEPGIAGKRTDGEAILALRKFRNDIRADIAAVRGEQAALEKAMQAVAGGQSVDLDAVRAAAREGVAAALKDLEADVSLTLTTDEG